MTDNLPVPDDAPWLNLSQEEIQELRKQKQEFTEYGKQKIKQMMMNQEPYPDEMFQEAERREAENKRPFYRFFAVEYFGTGEGMSFWLKICRNYGLYDGKDCEMERFKEFIGCSHYYPGIEEPTEEEFRTQYANLIPDYVSKMLDKKDQPGFDWETHYHFNYS